MITRYQSTDTIMQKTDNGLTGCTTKSLISARFIDTSRKLRLKGKKSYPLKRGLIMGKIIRVIYSRLQVNIIQPLCSKMFILYSPMRGSLQAQDGPSRSQLIESSRGSETPQYSQGSRNQEELRQGRSRPQAEDRYESPSINHKSMTSRRSATPNRSQISHTHHSKPTVHCPYHCRSKSPVVEKKRDSTPQKSQKNITNLLLMSDMNSYMSKRNMNHDAQRETQYASIGQKDSETPQFIHGRPNGVQGNFAEYNSQQRSKSQNVVPPSPQNRGYQSQFKRIDPPVSQQNYYIPTSPRPYPPQSARTDSIQATRMISPSMVTGIENMSDEEKVRYFQRLQQNYRQSGYNNDDVAPTRPKKRGQLIPTVVEYRYIEKPQKDRGYGCSNCQIF